MDWLLRSGASAAHEVDDSDATSDADFVGEASIGEKSILSALGEAIAIALAQREIYAVQSTQIGLERKGSVP